MSPSDLVNRLKNLSFNLVPRQDLILG
jgi:hypothetical protein